MDHIGALSFFSKMLSKILGIFFAFCKFLDNFLSKFLFIEKFVNIFALIFVIFLRSAICCTYFFAFFCALQFFQYLFWYFLRYKLLCKKITLYFTLFLAFLCATKFFPHLFLEFFSVLVFVIFLN